MYRVHSGSSVYEERSVASMNDAAPGVNTPRSAFATPNAAVSRTETAEARRPWDIVRTKSQKWNKGTPQRVWDPSHPIRIAKLHRGRMRGRSSEEPTERDFGFDRPQQYYDHHLNVLVHDWSWLERLLPIGTRYSKGI